MNRALQKIRTKHPVPGGTRRFLSIIVFFWILGLEVR